MVALLDGLRARVSDVRRRRPVVDHLVLMQEHYTAVKAGQQAGGVTYFAFLSFFPVLALAFFVVGQVSQIWPDANMFLREAINEVLPGIVGPRDDQVSLRDIRTFSGWVGVLGFAGVLYTGLGWVSALREALQVLFETPRTEQPSFVLGKVRDLLMMAVLGVVLTVAVALTGFVSGFSEDVLEWLDLDQELGWLVKVLTVALGLTANTVLFYAMFRLPTDPHAPRRSLLAGALLGGVLFEALKQASTYLLALTRDQPAFQAFGIALVLLVWMNYFSRIVLYAAAWAHTSAAARALRLQRPVAPVQGPRLPAMSEHEEWHEVMPSANPGEGRGDGATVRAAFAAGAVAGAGMTAVLRKVWDPARRRGRS